MINQDGYSISQSCWNSNQNHETQTPKFIFCNFEKSYAIESFYFEYMLKKSYEASYAVEA